MSTIKLGHTLKEFKWLEFTSFDRGSYNISLPLKNVIKNGFLALYQNGEPIRPEQGYPVRLIIPGWEGSTHVKWLKKLLLEIHQFSVEMKHLDIQIFCQMANHSSIAY